MTLPGNRPDSWNCRMLNGEPLIADQQFEQLLANGEARPPTIAEIYDVVPVVKIFLPHIRFLLIALDDEDLDSAFVVVKQGNKREPCTVSLSDIVGARTGAVTPERDKYITLNRPWTYYLSHEW
jgi:hypothetical protein